MGYHIYKKSIFITEEEKKMLSRLKKSKKGFTLVELIVVIAIIAIMAAVAVPLTMNYVGKAKKATAESDAGTIASNIQLAYTEVVNNDLHGAFTLTTENVDKIMKKLDAPSANITNVVFTTANASKADFKTITLLTPS